LAVIQTNIEEEQQEPDSQFYAKLKGSRDKTRRQRPRRLKIAFDFIMDLSSKSKSLEEQARAFVTMTKNNPEWSQNNLIRFLSFQRAREGKSKKGYQMQLFPTITGH